MQAKITALWETLITQQCEPHDTPHLQETLQEFLNALDKGIYRAAEKDPSGTWCVNTWVKEGILLCLRFLPFAKEEGHTASWDKIPTKTKGWSEKEFSEAGVRYVHGAIARRGSFLAPTVVQMPSYVNVGAYVGCGTMVDTWATIGACAQIGQHCHISGGAGIGGVLEPIQASPVIIEDNCFVGARSEVVEGIIVEEGAVIGMGVFLSSSTPIVDRITGEISYGRIPSGAVVLSGTLPSKLLPNGQPGPHMPCAIIVKRVDEQTRKKTAINELLRQSVDESLTS